MSAKDVAIEFKAPVRLVVTTEGLRKFNEYHIGRKTVPLDEEWPDSQYGYKMRELHNMIRTVYTVEVVVEVLEDGSLQLKKQQSG